MAGKYFVEVLGALRVTRDSKLLDLSPSAARAVAVLALHPALTRNELAELLWPDSPPLQGASNARTVLWRIARTAPDLLTNHGPSVSLGGAHTDMGALSSWMNEALNSIEPIPPPLGATRQLLPGWDEPWVVAAREQMHLIRMHALEATASAYLRAGRLGPAAAAAMGAVTLDPLRESAVRLLIEIHLRGDNTVDALKAFHRFANLLQEELGTAPSPTLTAMVTGYLEERLNHGRGSTEALLRHRRDLNRDHPRRI